MSTVSSLDYLNASLSIREAQLSTTASNLANQDTPNYKAKGVDFNRELNNIISDTPVGLNKTHQRHMDAANSNGGFNVLYVESGVEKADGNTVNGSLEKSKFAEYQVQYQAALEFSTKKFNSELNAYKDSK
ncbi:flagellar basal body rod protein FlgB [Vibrio crassostreae]|uniref:flagellar basal body rod protein FlgB n=1 Tax=Vibrio crassostreae TaxID=246167 RepID=UPI001B307FD6|nr:flagellar basal body rod protein FlgB [Vibrio crassostreae]